MTDHAGHDEDHDATAARMAGGMSPDADGATPASPGSVGTGEVGGDIRDWGGGGGAGPKP